MGLLNHKKILIVEDENIIATYLAKIIEQFGGEIIDIVATQEKAIESASEQNPDLILMDINLDGCGNGIETSKEILKKNRIPIIYTSSYFDDETIAKAVETSAYGYIVKPYDVKVIKTTCEMALARFDYETQHLKAKARLKIAIHAARLSTLEFNSESEHFTLDAPDYLLKKVGAKKIMNKSEFLNLFSSQDKTKLINDLKENNLTIKTFQIKTPQGSIWLDIAFSDILIDAKRKIHVGAVIDVTEKHEQIQQLKLSEVILNQLSEAVVIFDSNLKIHKFNQSFLKLTGHNEEDILESHIDHFFLFAETSNEHSFPFNLENDIRTESQLLTAEGQHIPVMIAISKFNEHEIHSRRIATITDITQIKKSAEQLNKLAFTDPLTNIGNRNFLNNLIIKTQKSKQKFSIVFIDVDSFKLINDTYGHATGDEVLVEIAKRLGSTLRKSDRLIRQGGDEFIIFMGEVKDIKPIQEKILSAFKNEFITTLGAFKVTASIGIAHSSDHSSMELSEILKQADIAMFEAKKQGKNRAIEYEASQTKSMADRLFIEQGLHDALANDEINAYFQPIINTKGSVSAVEALCRWTSKTQGDISPNIFIPIAEETHLINGLGMKMLQEACLAKLKLNIANHYKVVMHINVSVIQLLDKNFVSSFKLCLDNYKLTPEEFVLEVTESELQSPPVRMNIIKLKTLGFKIAIDDFGTGYASIAELKQEYYDSIKIDRSLMPLSSETQSNKFNTDLIITNQIIELCRKIGKSVTFEGVETQGNADYVTAQHCDYQQGFFYAKPMPLNELLTFIEKREEDYPV